MKNIFFSVIVLQCLFVVRGSDFYESSFSNIVGCLERTQVTILMPGIHNHPLFDYLAEEKFPLNSLFSTIKNNLYTSGQQAGRNQENEIGFFESKFFTKRWKIVKFREF